MLYQRDKPYNDLPPLPPNINLESPALLRKVISSSRALAELKGALRNLPNPTLFIDTINLQEAKASSAIENIVTTDDELFRASVATIKNENAATKEVIHYKEALWFAMGELEKRPVLTTNLFIAIVQKIKKNGSGIRNAPGTQLKNAEKGDVVYTPPEGEQIIRNKLQNLEEFIHADDNIDPLIKMAIIHYQFEAIHPFFDGNGRTGRILLLLYLKYSGLLDLPALYLSDYIINKKTEYYTNLRNVTEKEGWETWILYMLDMIEVTASQARIQIAAIDNLMKEMGKEIQATLPKIYSKDLLEAIFHLPYTKRTSLTDRGIGNLKTAGAYLNALEEKGFLRSEIVGKEKIFLNKRLMDILKRRG